MAAQVDEASSLAYRAQLGRARVFIEESRLSQAEGAALDAEALLDVGDPSLWLIWAEIARLQGDIDASRAHLDSARARSRETDDLLSAQISFHGGELAHASSDDDAALQLFAEAESVYEREKDWIGLARTRNRAAEILTMRGSLAEARAILESSLRDQDPDDFRNLVRSRQIRADIDFRQGRAERALAELGRGLEESLERGYDRGEADTRIEMGKIVAHDDIAGARTHFERALELYGAMRDEPGEANALLQIAQLDRRQGRFDEAVDKAQRARNLFERLGNPLGQANSGLQLAMAAAEKGNRDEARNQLAASHDIFHAISNAHGVHYSHLIAEMIDLDLDH